MITHELNIVHEGEWLGLFSHPNEAILFLTLKNSIPHNHILILQHQTVILLRNLTTTTIGLSSRQLSFILASYEDLSYSGFVQRIRVVQINGWENRNSQLFYTRDIRSLEFDPNRWQWNKGHKLRSYTTSLG